jgi:hypothetical protein
MTPSGVSTLLSAGFPSAQAGGFFNAHRVTGVHREGEEFRAAHDFYVACASLSTPHNKVTEA